MTGFRILLAADDASQRELLALVLTGAFPGAEVRAPTDGLDLAEALIAGSFDAAVVCAPLAWAPVDRVLVRIQGAGRSAVLVADPTAPLIGDALRIGAAGFVAAGPEAPLRVRDELRGMVLGAATRSGRSSLPVDRPPTGPTEHGRSITVDFGAEEPTEGVGHGTRPAAPMPAAPVAVAPVADPAPPEPADLRSYSATVQAPAYRPGEPPDNPLADLLGAAGVGYFRCDPGGKVLSVSDAACRLLGGLRPAQVLQRRRLGLDSDEWRDLLERLRAEGELDGARVVLPLPGGQRRVFALTLRWLGTPPDAPLEGLLVDRNEEERLWQRLQEVRLEGAGEPTGEATGVIDLQERRARRAGDPSEESSLLAELSHDLREPLRSVRIYAELLAEEHGDELDPAALELVTRSRAAADRMGRMLTEVMSEASGDFTSEPEADAEAVLDGLLDVLQPRIEEAGATVTHDPLPTVAISAVQLDRLLQNLVVNAIQYRGDEPPRVHVSAREQKDRWILAVADNGRGVPRKLQERIFDRYERGRSGDGMGLGLAVCKRIVESHGGSITVHSEGEGGSTFEFSLPKRRKSGTA